MEIDVYKQGSDNVLMDLNNIRIIFDEIGYDFDKVFEKTLEDKTANINFRYNCIIHLIEMNSVNISSITSFIRNEKLKKILE